ncbi:uncharacterized protein LOC104435755 [Eucalyptus grandis]|uniref:Uncharacterized protein n=2 Tax=Eucalyptus grandis TaxID=71139 RepID=A0ACC3M398_EUCGR|nr:uncharacterized protein LOC104435755 [Eucalyptus grandis]KAK3445361.1 hypothetical protein EUGRSUZ_A01165 [Eucalyptus grandis]
MAMADASYSSICLVGIMDRLWFHQIIFFSEPVPSLSGSKTQDPQEPDSATVIQRQPSSMPELPPPDSELHSMAEESPLAGYSFSSLDPSDSSMDDTNKSEDAEEEIRPTRVTHLIASRARRSHSSSPSTQKRPRKQSSEAKKLLKSMSCRTFEELEMKEVKGFMDLGFIFKKEHLSPRMVSVVPGLHRLGRDASIPESATNDEEGKREIMRPYLSEAWLIKRPDSPLLNLRVPRAYEASDMKKHLKFWARTVASEIHQES